MVVVVVVIKTFTLQDHCKLICAFLFTTVMT
jgi:hypothetical protein